VLKGHYTDFHKKTGLVHFVAPHEPLGRTRLTTRAQNTAGASVTVAVTAEDGVTTKGYTITILDFAGEIPPLPPPPPSPPPPPALPLSPRYVCETPLAELRTGGQT
jgi:hypothetical protein